MKRAFTLIAVATAVLLASCGRAAAPPLTDEVLAQFERELEVLRQELKIPGLSAAIVKDQELVWAKGFGYADLENSIPATPDTPYRLASATKPIAATLIMQLVEGGTLDLDDPVRKYGVQLESEGVVRVYHLLTHTSEGVPGTRHNYSGLRYSLLGAVIEEASCKPFEELLAERILEPLDMANTVPSRSECDLAELLASAHISERERKIVRVHDALARPYQLDGAHSVVEGFYPSGCSPAYGLISTVADLAKFDIALDKGVLIDEETVAQMTRPTFSTYGERTDLSYGLGWYAQQFMDTRLVWHSGGWPPSVSSLYLKVPDQGLTFIILANTTYLTTPYPFGDGDAMYCTPALLFYKTFVFPQQYGRAVPDVDWSAPERDLVDQLAAVKNENVREVLERELWSYRQLYTSMGEPGMVSRLSRVYVQVFGGSGENGLDTYASRGVQYIAPVRARVELAEADLAPFAGTYTLSEAPEAEAVGLPPALSVEVREGRLVGVASGSCVALVPIAPTRFAIPESPGTEVAFQLDENGVARLTLEAGGLVAEYVPAG